MRSSRLRWRRWHRTLGIAVVPVVFSLALTGIALNHTDALSLDQRFVQTRWLLQWYGMASDAGSAQAEFEAGGLRVRMDSSADQLWLNNESVIAPCVAPLQGAIAVTQPLPSVVILCLNTLVWVTNEAQLIESFSSLPINSDRLGQLQGDWLLQAGRQYYQFNPDSATASPIAAARLTDAHWSKPVDRAFSKSGSSQARHVLSWERVMLDLHSGRLFGRAGVWLFDVTAVVLIVLLITGIRIWWSGRR